MEIERAVVLGPGGVVGTAWTAGLVQGLRDRGIDLGTAGRVVGTSAGAIVAAAMTTGRDLRELADLPSRNGGVALSGDRLEEVFAVLGAEGLRGVGRLAVEAAPYPEERHRAQMAHLVGGDPEWPETELLIVTVDGGAGEPRIWRRGDGQRLAAVVAASSAMPTMSPPVTLGGSPHFDGALRADVNTDLAGDARFTIVLEPMGHRFPTPPLPVPGLKILPDEASNTAMGPDVGSGTAWPAAYRAGRAQAATVEL